VVELLDAIRRRNELEASTAAGSAAAAAAAAAVRAAPLAARSKTDSRLLQQMRRGRSPGVGPGGSNAAAAAAGGSGSNAAAGSNAPAGVAAVRPEKAIVFSQWTSMLDLLEVPLKKAGFVFRRLDGTMTVAARERAIADFESSPEVRLLALLQQCRQSDISDIYPAFRVSVVALLACRPGVDSAV
jgi:superfamily II DNA/RNA helicase